VIVELDAFDLMEITLLAERVASVRKVLPSKKERILTDSSFEGHVIGFTGEVSVCKYFGLRHPHTLNSGGDGGAEFSYKGRSIQVKCRPFTSPFTDLIFATKEYFSADVTIMTKMLSPTTVDILGCISRSKARCNASLGLPFNIASLYFKRILSAII